jgi:hypothetical protein
MVGVKRVAADMHFSISGSDMGSRNRTNAKESEGAMMDELAVDAAICSDYEALLKESQRALVTWRERSEEVLRFGLQGKNIGDELQKLQADYATAYHRLEQHGKTCILCQFTFGLMESETPGAVFISPRRELPA